MIEPADLVISPHPIEITKRIQFLSNLDPIENDQGGTSPKRVAV